MNLKRLLWPALVVIATVGFVACTGNNDKQDQSSKQTVDAKKILEDETLTPEQKSAQLTEAGELLFTPEAFFLADRVFEQAIKLDGKNKKAEFYKEMLKPAMNMKGIVTRIKPYMKKDPVEDARFQARYFDNVEKRSPLLDKFLKDGQEDIKTEAQAQAFIESQIAVYDELRKYLRSNKDLALDINVAPQWYDQRLKHRGMVCEYTEIHDFTYEIDCKANINHMKLKVDRGDIEAMKNSVAGMQIWTILTTAYDLDGFQKYMVETRDKKLTQKQRIEAMLKTSDKLGTLRESQVLESILDLGIDGMAGLRWAQENQETLCPVPTVGSKFVYDASKNRYRSHYNEATGEYSYSVQWGKAHIRRPGHLFDEGLCPHQPGTKVGKLYDLIENALKGQVVVAEGRKKIERLHHHTYKPWTQDEETGEWIESDTERSFTYVSLEDTDEKVKANIQPAVAFKSPLTDLRSVLPSEYNDCENIKSFKDNTLGGVFVDGDADKFLSETKEINLQEGLCTIEY